MRILVTGSAGFIGFHLTKKLLELGCNVVGLDNLNDYYDMRLKLDRLKCLEVSDTFKFVKLGLEDRKEIGKLFVNEQFDKVIHLAAQAGVRYSINNPYAYVDSNLVGFMSILEGCRHTNVNHLIYASSSSVYGGNTRMPFSEHDSVDHPVSLYAATKKANELMAHTYSSLYGLPTTGLRFFTVYGPWGRPDMACFLFTKAILEGRSIDLYNYGEMKRDFTYIDDIVEGIVKVVNLIPAPNAAWDRDSPNPATSYAPYRVYNIGNNNPVSLVDFVKTIEGCLGKTAKINLLPIQAGDIPTTFADIDNLFNDTGFKPSVSIKDGMQHFVNWYLEYYQNS